MTTISALATRLAAATLLALCLLPGACGDDGGDATADTTGDTSADTGEVVDLTGKSVYSMTITLDDGEVLQIDRDLTGKDIYYAFGSTHIAPAVSFAVSDNLTFPRTMIININFGIVVPSDDFPIQTTGVGSYAFPSADPPNIDVFVKQLEYTSTDPSASGELVVDQWSVTTGDVVAGSFQGTLVHPQTQKQIQIVGSYHFILPERAGGQPGG